MDHQRFKLVLENHVRPMFTGSELSEQDENPRWKKRQAFLRNVCEMIVRTPGGEAKCFSLKRSQAFDQADADFVESFIKHLDKLDAVTATPLLDDLINPLLRRTVAQRVASPASDLVSRILAQYEAWAEQTYEGRKISAAIGLDPGNATATGVQVLKVFAESFGAVLANGLESFLIAGANGDLVGYEPLSNAPGGLSLAAPLRFCRLAEWAAGQKVGVGLNRNGEILVFANQGIIFAKRRGSWRHFTHEALIKRIALHGSFEPDLCKAVYQTSLDVSFAKTGGGIALIRRTKANDLRTAAVVNDKDLRGATTLKGQCLKTIIGKPFQQLDRRLRQDIVAMDGATVLDYRGNVLAAGAIVKVDAGSDGGGRLLAARTLAKYGLGIKISTDGEIRGFKTDGSNVQEIFRFA